MTFRNTTTAWGSLSKALHWLIVLLIINQWVIASRADSLPNGLAKLEALAWHKSFGITILALAVIRLIWRWMNPTPELASVTKPWERALAKISHVLLYGFLFAMPLTGWMMSSAQELPRELVQAVPVARSRRAVGKRVSLMHSLHEGLNRGAGRGRRCCTSPARSSITSSTSNDVLKRMLPFSGAK